MYVEVTTIKKNWYRQNINLITYFFWLTKLVCYFQYLLVFNVILTTFIPIGTYFTKNYWKNSIFGLSHLAFLKTGNTPNITRVRYMTILFKSFLKILIKELIQIDLQTTSVWHSIYVGKVRIKAFNTFKKAGTLKTNDQL